MRIYEITYTVRYSRPENKSAVVIAQSEDRAWAMLQDLTWATNKKIQTLSLAAEKETERIVAWSA